MNEGVARAVDEAATRVVRSRGRLDLAIGETLVVLFEGGRLPSLNWSKQVDYARERLGIAPRTMYQLTRLAREMATRPVMREAVAEGRVSPRRALEAFGCGDDFEVETLILRMKEEEQDRLDAALSLAKEVVGYDTPRWKRLAYLAMEWLGEFAEFAPEVAGPIEVTAPVERHLCALEEMETDLPRDAESLDARVMRLLLARREYDLVIGPLLLRISQERLWKYLGYRCFAEYVTERLFLSERSARQRLWLERRLGGLPEIREALADGRLTYTKALIVAKDAKPEGVLERIAEVSGTTWQQAEAESTAEEDRQSRAHGVRRLWAPVEAFETVSSAITSAQELAKSRGEVITAGEALARVADHFVSVWVLHLKDRKIPKRRKEVLLRNGGLCAVPGCSRAAEQAHHIHYRSRGGSDDASNLVGLCEVHHLRGVHRGRLVVSGRAGERLEWRFATGEVWVTLGAGCVQQLV